jgi:hypothetical protein
MRTSPAPQRLPAKCYAQEGARRFQLLTRNAPLDMYVAILLPTRSSKWLAKTPYPPHLPHHSTHQQPPNLTRKIRPESAIRAHDPIPTSHRQSSRYTISWHRLRRTQLQRQPLKLFKPRLQRMRVKAQRGRKMHGKDVRHARPRRRRYKGGQREERAH